MPISPASSTPFLTISDSCSRCMLHGFPSYHTLEMPTCALFKSALVSPVACNIACEAPWLLGWVIVLLYSLSFSSEENVRAVNEVRHLEDFVSREGRRESIVSGSHSVQLVHEQIFAFFFFFFFFQVRLSPTNTHENRNATTMRHLNVSVSSILPGSHSVQLVHEQIFAFFSFSSFIRRPNENQNATTNIDHQFRQTCSLNVPLKAPDAESTAMPWPSKPWPQHRYHPTAGSSQNMPPLTPSCSNGIRRFPYCTSLLGENHTLVETCRTNQSPHDMP
mmetsp:Transcript_152/g.312  ORF Transcript_152/g.312 Transcript_152/m.312 type:complete len:277 (-) Transcript_152:1632-2462(-)